MRLGALQFLLLAVATSAIGACATGGAARPQAFPGAHVAVAANNGDDRPAPSVSNPGNTAPAATGAAVIETAVTLLGTPYRLGGGSPESGFDCSGFVAYVLKQHAIDVPRTVAEQFQIGRPVKESDLSPGDLVFFSTTGPGATHVGLVIATGPRLEFIHAPADGSSVRVERFDSEYWRRRWIGARRVF